MATDTNLTTLLADFTTLRQIMLQDMFSKATPGHYADYTEVKDASGHRVLEWAFLANIPRMRQWIGARQKKAPRGYRATVEWLKYESTLILNADDLRYDPTGVVNDAVTQHTKNTIDFLDEVSHTAYNSNSGVGPTGYDGVALFSASHPHGPTGATTQSNIGAASTLTDANIKTAIIAGNGLREENGRTFKVNYTELHVGPKSQFIAQELFHATRAVVFGSDTAAATIENALAGAVKLVVDERDQTFYWTLRDPKMPKPIILLVGKNPTPEERTRPDDEPMWERNEMEFGIVADVGAAALAWQGVYRGTATAAPS